MNGLEGYQKQQVLSAFRMRLLAKKRLFRQESRLKIHRTLCKKPCRLIRRMLCFKQQRRGSAGQVIGIQSFSDDPLLEGFDPSQFNQLYRKVSLVDYW